MNRRGNIQVMAGDLDNLSPEDRNRLLDKVKEKLVERLNPEDAGEEQSEEQPQEDVEETTEEQPQEDIDTEEDEQDTDTEEDEQDTDTEEDVEEGVDTEEDEEDAPTIKLTASNSTGKGNKDKDVMDGTGGDGKHHIKPYANPPRDDCKKRFNYDKVRKEDRGDFSDTHNDPDLKKASSRRGTGVK